MAGSPGAICRPARVTVPTPAPATNSMRSSFSVSAGATAGLVVQPLHLGDDQHAVRDVRVVAGVLEDGGAGAATPAASRATRRRG